MLRGFAMTIALKMQVGGYGKSGGRDLISNNVISTPKEA
jgi:hypothetical protein